MKTLQGLPQTVLILAGGGQSTVNLGRICIEDFARITSDNVDPGGGSINSQLGKDPQRLCKDCLCNSVDPGRGDQSTVNLGRICEDFARITSDSVDANIRGSIDLVNLGRICEDFARITSDSYTNMGGYQ